MKANELRIGNLVIYKWFDKNYSSGKQRTIIHREIVKVIAIDSVNNRVLINTNQTRKNQTWVSIGAISPINLTEEILLKCGFEVSFTSDPQECGASKMYRIDLFKIHQPDEDNLFFVFVIDNEFIQLKHLHQLQNLYYALKQQELQVNL